MRYINGWVVSIILHGIGGGFFCKRGGIYEENRILYYKRLDVYKRQALKDIGIAKNYLEENERKVLNNLVSGYFDLAEINAIEHKPMYMDDYVKQLDSVLSSGNRKLLTGSGSVSHKQALEKAKSEYRKYQEITLTPVSYTHLVVSNS